MTINCYYCGLDATTEEHTPPRAIFPKPKDSPDGRDYRKNLIKVPSCEVHNTEKSKEDEYLLYVLVMSLPSNEIAKNQFLTKVRRAIDRRPKLLARLLIETREVVIHDTANDTWHKTIAIRPEEKRLVGIFTCIAKALYFHEMKCPWQGRVSVLSEFMLSFDDIAKFRQRERRIRKKLKQFSRHRFAQYAVRQCGLNDLGSRATPGNHFGDVRSTTSPVAKAVQNMLRKIANRVRAGITPALPTPPSCGSALGG